MQGPSYHESVDIVSPSLRSDSLYSHCLHRCQRLTKRHQRAQCDTQTNNRPQSGAPEILAYNEDLHREARRNTVRTETAILTTIVEASDSKETATVPYTTSHSNTGRAISRSQTESTNSLCVSLNHRRSSFASAEPREKAVPAATDESA